MKAQLRVLTAMAFLALLGACAASDPREGAAIEYRLPRTDAVVKLTVYLKDCRGSGYEVIGEASLAAKPGVGDHVYRVSGEHLVSAIVKRSMTISVSEDGVLTAVNATNQDQTAAIVESVGKILGNVATMALLFKNVDTGEQCTGPFTAAHEHLRRAKQLEAAIDDAKVEIDRLWKTDPKRTQPDVHLKHVRLMRRINEMARELVAIRMDYLKVETEGALKISAPVPMAKPEPVKLDAGPFKKWFEPGITFPIDDSAATKARQLHNQKAAKKALNSCPSTGSREEIVNQCFPLVWGVGIKQRTVFDLPPGTSTMKPPGTTVTAAPQATAADDGCKLPLQVPQITPVEVWVTSTTGGLLEGGEIDGKATIPAAQLTTPAVVCLDVKFGENRTVGLKFDKYGRTTELTWNSEATGATVAGSFAGASGAAAGILTTLQGPSDLDKMKKEIDALETQQKLNSLLACKAIIEAGGYKCEEEGDEE